MTEEILDSFYKWTTDEQMLHRLNIWVAEWAGRRTLAIASPSSEIFQSEDPVVPDERIEEIHFAMALIFPKRRGYTTVYSPVHQKSVEGFVIE